MNAIVLRPRPRIEAGPPGLQRPFLDARRADSRLECVPPDWTSKRSIRLARATGEGASAHPGGSAPLTSDEAFADLVRPHLPQVLRVARNQLGCEHLAWEAVQDALLGMWAQSVAPPNPKAWLIRAVMFRSLHMGRMIRRRLKHERRSGLSRREAIDDVPPSRPMIAEEIQRTVRAALDDLNEKHREVATLHLIEGLTYEAIARRLRVPIGTVRSRLSRARKALIDRLASTVDESR